MLLFIQVKDDMAILNHGNIRKIDTGKCIVALRPLLFPTGSGNHLTVKDDGDAACAVVAGKTKAVIQVDPGIRVFHIDGLLGTGYDNGLCRRLDQIGEGGRRISHGIRSVTDYKAVVFLIMCLDGFRHGKPVFWLHIGAVYIENLKAVRLTELCCIRNV